MSKIIVYSILQLLSMNGIYYHYNEFASLKTKYTEFKILYIDIASKKFHIYSNDGIEIASFDIEYINPDKLSIPKAGLYFKRMTNGRHKLEFQEEYKIGDLNYIKLEPQKLNSEPSECIFKEQLIELNNYVFFKETGRMGQPFIYPVKSLSNNKIEYFDYSSNKIESKSALEK